MGTGKQGQVSRDRHATFEDGSLVACGVAAHGARSSVCCLSPGSFMIIVHLFFA
jgi:hypothetical protein